MSDVFKLSPEKEKKIRERQEHEDARWDRLVDGIESWGTGVHEFVRAYRERTAHFIAQTERMFDKQDNVLKQQRSFAEYLEDALSNMGIAPPRVRVKEKP